MLLSLVRSRPKHVRSASNVQGQPAKPPQQKRNGKEHTNTEIIENLVVLGNFRIFSISRLLTICVRGPNASLFLGTQIVQMRKVMFCSVDLLSQNCIFFSGGSRLLKKNCSQKWWNEKMLWVGRGHPPSLEMFSHVFPCFVPDTCQHHEIDYIWHKYQTPNTGLGRNKFHPTRESQK